MAWHEDGVVVVTRLLTEVKGRSGDRHLFTTQGTAITAKGWSALEHERADEGASAAAAPRFPPGLAVDDPQLVVELTPLRKQTTPPKPHTEATLLSAMEGAGKQLQDESLRETMREAGLGTPATRAATIETLLKRAYLTRQGKSLISTQLGRALIRAVHPAVASPEMTGRWEQRLRRMERGEEELTRFMRDIATYVSEAVRVEATKPEAPRQPAASATRPQSPQRRRTRPRARH
jgi:DNA topoisomerase-3